MKNVDWYHVKKILEIDEVHDLVYNFAHDPCEDNAVGMAKKIIETYESERVQLAEQAIQRMKKLKEFSNHKISCETITYFGNVCTCGYEKLLKEI